MLDRKMWMTMFLVVAGAATLAWSTASSPARGKENEEITVYSSRDPAFVEPLLKVFEQLTRIKLNLVHISDGVVERLAREGDSGPADLLLTAEFSQLVAAKSRGLTRPSETKVLTDNIPSSLRDPDGHWFAVSERARVVLAAKDRVAESSITYEALADPKWRGRICVRSGRHPYNVGLVASLIVHKGEAWTEQWLRGVKANLAQKPSGGDRDQILNIHAGKCDLALVNTYYLGIMQAADASAAHKVAVAAVKPLFPNAADRGTHVSISGMAMTTHARNSENAALLMDFLVSEPAQFIYALDNHEYPIRPGVAVSEHVARLGQLKPDGVALGHVAGQSDKALELINKVGFDNGPDG